MHTSNRRFSVRALQGVFAAAAVLLSASAFAQAAVSVSVAGEIKPGVYGRIDIGSAAPPPRVVYAQPVTIVRPQPRAVVVQPIYLHVPPGHARNWRKHCHRYEACGRPVYFVHSSEYDPPKHHRKDHHRKDHHGKGQSHHH